MCALYCLYLVNYAIDFFWYTAPKRILLSITALSGPTYTLLKLCKNCFVRSDALGSSAFFFAFKSIGFSCPLKEILRALSRRNGKIKGEREWGVVGPFRCKVISSGRRTRD